MVCRLDDSDALTVCRPLRRPNKLCASYPGWIGQTILKLRLSNLKRHQPHLQTATGTLDWETMDRMAHPQTQSRRQKLGEQGMWAASALLEPKQRRRSSLHASHTKSDRWSRLYRGSQQVLYLLDVIRTIICHVCSCFKKAACRASGYKMLLHQLVLANLRESWAL